MARRSNDGKGDGKSEAAVAKGSDKGERGAPPAAAEAGAPPKSWAHRHAGTIYILGAFGIVVLIAVLRAGCN